MEKFNEYIKRIKKYFKGYVIKEPVLMLEVYYIPKTDSEVLYTLNRKVKNFYNANPVVDDLSIDEKIFHLKPVGGKMSLDHRLLDSGNVNAIKSKYTEIYSQSFEIIKKEYAELYEIGHIFNWFDEIIKIRYGQNIECYKYNKFQRIIQDIPPEYYIDLEYSNGKLQIKSYENIKYFQDWQKQKDWYKEIIK